MDDPNFPGQAEKRLYVLTTEVSAKDERIVSDVLESGETITATREEAKQMHKALDNAAQTLDCVLVTGAQASSGLMQSASSGSRPANAAGGKGKQKNKGKDKGKVKGKGKGNGAQALEPTPVIRKVRISFSLVSSTQTCPCRMGPTFKYLEAF